MTEDILNVFIHTVTKTLFSVSEKKRKLVRGLYTEPFFFRDLFPTP